MGLPRLYYRFKTTVARATPSPYGQAVHIAEPEVSFTPSIGYVPDGYDDQGPWYGGPHLGHWNHVPYDCG